MENRQDLIHQKGFAMGSNFVHGGPGDAENVINYNKIKVGVKTLEDAVFNLGDLVKNGNRNLANKGLIMKALADKLNGREANVCDLRETYISHLIAFAAEESRLTGKVVDMKEFEERFERA